ncbi:ABC transporter ATP-binding protein [Marinigracilibium pacificum]|uniref:ABC transporter ATP-binding protein n=1 Tax=Marinigracilibium pacificum TaxID=2729599 RepID=A0A848J2Y0_9BACT|nr:ABC transporter ATP-binding protein [Marinigracilibium pacificum]NMM50116.1 ABC transporter ATP-binding protein [Marinigracilibium pacificum]
MIELQNLDKYIDAKFQRIYMLKAIDLKINQGEFLTIMGPSGAGKSTLLNILGMLDDASEGKYKLDGNDIYSLKSKQRSELAKTYFGFVFQAYHLIDELTVYENIETPLLYRKVPSKERKSMVAEMLDRFNMVAKKDLFPDQLSGGQQQLVGVARAIIGKPKILLADEPTGNLHSKQAAEVMEIFKQLNEEDGTTIIQVTHDEKNASYGNRIVELVDGRIENDYKTQHIKSNY